LQYREQVHICDEGQHVRAYRIVSASSRTDFVLNGELSAYMKPYFVKNAVMVLTLLILKIITIQ